MVCIAPSGACGLRAAWFLQREILSVSTQVFWKEQDGTFYGSFYGGLVHAKWTYIFGLVHYSVRISRPISKLGQDLHTAALDGDLPLTRKLLKPDQNGQVLDVNATAKDGRGMTCLGRIFEAECSMKNS
ncbi:unnamed protein product [Symbiodinium sp. CCMP2592]|nr:unnamed protein product [Symbiodinium sp. CCMP2592]